MRQRFAIAISAVVLLTAGSGLEGDPTHARQASKIVWQEDEAWFGGFSGLEVSADGTRFLALSDRGHFVEGRFERDADQTLVGVRVTGEETLRNARGNVPRHWQRDSEGLAWGGEAGPVFVSFEGLHKVKRFARPGGKAERLPSLPAPERFSRNGSLEALAIGPAGRLFVMAEDPVGDKAEAVVWRLDNGAWREFDRIARDRMFKPVGADVGPDGRFYLLERGFNGFGFRSRVRRFDLGENGFGPGEVLMRTGIGGHDNLEGIAVWRDEAGAIRVMLIADDNFRFFQRTEIVEYVVEENP